MNTNKITLEYELQSRSRTLVWQLISTADGLSHWLADAVSEPEPCRLVLQWGEEYGQHEIRRVFIRRLEREQCVELCFEDDTAVIRLSVLHDVLTDTLILHIEDEGEEEDADTLVKLWDCNREKLLQRTGV